MALKNLYDMVKADRYTADGREELIKAQEAETEDKVYQIGEISQKTGLQKTANGWVKPKNGKQPGAKKEEPKNVHGAEVDKIYERQLKRIKELKAKGFTDEQIDNDKIIKQTKEDMKNVGKKPESKPAEKHPPMVMPKGMSPAEFMKAWEDDAKKNGFKKGQGNEWREHLRKEEAESKPVLSQTDGKGNKVEIKISESKGGGFYVDKYVNGKKVGINNANTRESAEAKAKSMMEQHMADPDYKAESKPAAGIPDFKGMESGDYDNKLRAEGWTTGGWEGNGTHASAIFKKGDRTIRVNEGQPGKITSVQEISKPAADAAPRQLTGDTRIRVRKV